MEYLGKNESKNIKKTMSRQEYITLKKAEWSVHGASQYATLNDYKELIEIMGPEIMECIDQDFRINAALMVNNWAEKIYSAGIDRRDDMPLNPWEDWLLSAIINDQRTLKVYRTDDGLQILVKVERADSVIQHDYTSYLIQALDEFGYFSCDVIVIDDSELTCFDDLDKTSQIVYSRE